MVSRVIVCNFNCICNKSDCDKYFHSISDIEERMFFREQVYSSINPKEYNETDPEGVRKVPCKSGQLCTRKNCNFKHFISIEGRELLSKKWYQEKRKFKISKLISDLEDDSISKTDAATILRELYGIKKE